jgi:hypothetical protein
MKKAITYLKIESVNPNKSTPIDLCFEDDAVGLENAARQIQDTSGQCGELEIRRVTETTETLIRYGVSGTPIWWNNINS